MFEVNRKYSRKDIYKIKNIPKNKQKGKTRGVRFNFHTTVVVIK